jgi:hypothetical protein
MILVGVVRENDLQERLPCVHVVAVRRVFELLSVQSQFLELPLGVTDSPSLRVCDERRGDRGGWNRRSLEGDGECYVLAVIGVCAVLCCVCDIIHLKSHSMSCHVMSCCLFYPSRISRQHSTALCDVVYL